jgi:hypothetical protein
VKSARSRLHLLVQLPLRVRHEFKIGFYHEFFSPPAKFMKHYQQAFRHLLNIVPTVGGPRLGREGGVSGA